MRLSVHPGTRVRIPPSPLRNPWFSRVLLFFGTGKAVRKLAAFILDEILPQSLRGVTTKM